jgi:hypothetical protein
MVDGAYDIAIRIKRGEKGIEDFPVISNSS